jgi:hypothetical protein
MRPCLAFALINFGKIFFSSDKAAPFIGDIIAGCFSIAMRTASFDIFLQMTGLKKYHKSLCIPPHRSSKQDILSGR